MVGTTSHKREFKPEGKYHVWNWRNTYPNVEYKYGPTFNLESINIPNSIRKIGTMHTKTKYTRVQNTFHDDIS